MLDLHAHTTASDGVLSPTELVQLARARGLSALAVTDHDSTEGLAEALRAADDSGLRLVPGVELSTDVAQGEIHVLGYFVDAAGPVFQAQLDRLREGRLARGRGIVAQLADVGVELSWSRVLEIAGGGGNEVVAVGRPHVARALVERGHAASIDEAFDRFLVRGRPGFVERQRFTPEQAVATVLAAGGVPVLAHPVAPCADEPSDPAAGFARAEEWFGRLVEVGLGGLEVYYAGYDARTIAFLERLADQRGLIRTGGSDFHGPGRADLGSVSIPPEVGERVVDELAAAAAQAGRHRSGA